jgi:hypothetical protein
MGCIQQRYTYVVGSARRKKSAVSVYNKTMSEIHELILFITLAVVVFADLQGLRWVLGWVPTLSARIVRVLHFVVYLGLGGMVVTGLTMFSRDSAYLLSNPVFLVKMVFVAALIANSFLIGAHIQVASEKPFAQLSSGGKKKLIVSGIVSGVCWISAMLLGFSLE